MEKQKPAHNCLQRNYTKAKCWLGFRRSRCKEKITEWVQPVHIMYVCSYKKHSTCIVDYMGKKIVCEARADIGKLRQQKFSQLYFLRIHRSHFINVTHLNGYDDKTRNIVMKDGTPLPIGRTYYKEVSKILGVNYNF